MESTGLQALGDCMSAWTRPTKADIGLRVFASSLNNLFSETAIGMQHLLLSPESLRNLNSKIRHCSQWNVTLPKVLESDNEILLVKWLEEVLYRSEVHGQFLTDVLIMVSEDEENQYCSGQVDWIDVETIERELEIKAVTTHELKIDELSADQELASKWQEIPTFQGPGWFCDIVFDI